MFEKNSRNANNTIGYTRNVSNSRETGKQETNRNLKDTSNSRNACHSLDASNRSDTSNNSNASNKQH
jgi:hypothetical protein